MPITHSTVVGVADDGVSPVGTDEWNASHVDTGQPLTQSADLVLAADACLILSTRYEIASGITCEVGSDGILEII